MNNNGFEISSSACMKYSGDKEEVTVPQGVTSICISAFKDNKSMKRLVLPEGLITITYGAFSGCSALEEVVFPSTLKFIGESAFEFCKSLKYVHLPASIRKIGSKAFCSCESLEEVTCPPCPDGVTVGSFAFSKCRALRTASVIESAGHIDSGAFAECSSLEAAPVSDKLVKLGSFAFSCCSSLKEITLPGSVDMEQAMSIFPRCTSLERAVLKEGIKVLPESTFLMCSALKEISLPRSLTSLGRSAFSYCSALKSVSIPEGIEVLPPDIFDHCSALQEIRLPASLKTVEHDAFAFCFSLKNYIIHPDCHEFFTKDGALYSRDALICACGVRGDLVIPKGIIETAQGAAENCAKIKKVTFPEGFTSVEETSFNSCTGLREVIFPESLEYIGMYAFQSCNKLDHIDIPENTKYIGLYAFRGCRSLRTLTVPSGVETLESYSFADCKSLTSAEIKGAQNIGSGVFSGCENLRHISIMSSKAKINDAPLTENNSVEIYAPFLSPKKLRNKNVWDGIRCFCRMYREGMDKKSPYFKKYSDYIFLSRNDMYERAVTDESLFYFMTEENIIPETDILRLTEYAVEKGSPAVKLMAVQYKNRHIGPEKEEQLRQDHAEGILTGNLTEEDALMSWKYTAVTGGIIISSYTGDDTDVYVPETIGGLPVKVIAAGAFSPLSPYLPQSVRDMRKRITSITLSKNVMIAESSAFNGCVKLRSISSEGGHYLPGGTVLVNAHTGETEAVPFCLGADLVFPEGTRTVDSVDKDEYKYARSVELPGSMDVLSSNAFQALEFLKTLRLSEGIREISSAAFACCKGLEEVFIPASLAKINPQAFSGCCSLKKIHVDPENPVYSSKDNILFMNEGRTLAAAPAARGCFEIPQGITETGEKAFSGCRGLNAVIFPDTAVRAGFDPFCGCMDLQFVFIPESVKSINIPKGTKLFTICAPRGSFGEEYARENNLFYAEADSKEAFLHIIK